MQWIEGVQRQRGALGVMVSAMHDEAPVWIPAAKMGVQSLVSGKTWRRRLATSFSNWQPASTRAYLSVLGHATSWEGGHLAYSFMNDGKEYLVPAIVLIRALCRPIRFTAPWLFHPTGLELISNPRVVGESFSVELALPGVARWISEVVGLEKQFTWIWSYPSARRMWSSIYLYAQKDVLGLALPEGEIRAVFHGQAHGCQVAVTEMRIMQLDTDEKSDLSFAKVERSFVFHAGVAATSMAVSSVEQQFIQSLGKRQELLSADDWEKVKDLVAPESKRKQWRHSQHLILEGVLAKLVSGEPWRKLNYPAGDWRNVSTAYRNWKITGVWEELCCRLTAVNHPVSPHVV